MLEKAATDTGVRFTRASDLRFNEFLVLTGEGEALGEEDGPITEICVASNAPLRLIVDIVTLFRVESSLILRWLALVPFFGPLLVTSVRNQIAHTYYALFNEMGVRR